MIVSWESEAIQETSDFSLIEGFSIIEAGRLWLYQLMHTQLKHTCSFPVQSNLMTSHTHKNSFS